MRSDPGPQMDPTADEGPYTALDDIPEVPKRSEGLGHMRIMKNQPLENWGHHVRVIKSYDDQQEDV